MQPKMPDVRRDMCLHNLFGENMGVRTDPVSIIANLLKAETNGMFNVGRLGCSDCNPVRESGKSSVGSQRFGQFPVADIVNCYQDTRRPAYSDGRRKDVSKDNAP